jgi:CheY-like chemotaxis protein
MPEADCHLILVIDDDDDTRTVLHEYLSFAGGFRIETAANGLEGVRLARQLRPHAIIMDLEMPGMSGLAAIHELQADGETRRVPILVLSALGPNDETVRRALAAGAVELFTKPIDLKFVERRLRHHCAEPAKG